MQSTTPEAKMFEYKTPATGINEDPYHRESVEAIYYNMIGKQVKDVFTGGSFEGNHMTSLRVVFEDGTSIEMRAHDGSQIDVARSVSR
jgi:hypothetical protein